jgi:hypothetical protein
MELQDRLAQELEARGITPLSWRSPEPVYDLAFELGDDIVVVEVKTLATGGAKQQVRLGAGQLLEYRQLLSTIHGRRVRGVLMTSSLVGEPWPEVMASSDMVLQAAEGPDVRTDALLERLTDESRRSTHGVQG